MNKIRDIQQVEALFRVKVADKVIRTLLKRRGITVTVLRKKVIPSASEFNLSSEADTLSQSALDVFGDFSGVSPGKSEPILGEVDEVTGNIEFPARIVIAKIPNDPWDSAASGMLEKQIIYTQDDLVPQDLIIIKSEDGTIKRGVLGSKLNWGLTDSVYFAYEYNNLGDSLET